ncbi:MAG: lysophospholipid acyltransferase family protein [Candidatus Omnitrophota bacterium]
MDNHFWYNPFNLHMDFKKIRKWPSRFFGWLGLNLCSLIIRCVPGRLVYNFADGIAALGYIIARKQRKIARESLLFAFGKDKTAQEIEGIARDCFSCMAKSGVELMFLMDKPNLLRKRVGFCGRKNLDTALAKKKGVILVSAHFGNFPLLLARLAMEGYKTGGIMRPMRDSRTEKFFLAKRQRYNVKTIYSQPRRECVEETIRALRQNEVIFIPIDQNFGSAGVFVDFFGRKAATATGPAVLARRTGAALVPCFIVRQKDDIHKIVFEPAVELMEGGEGKASVVANIQRLTQIIEHYIRSYPAQWGWIHRRWKSRPN